jgi:hypothetical protein
MRSTEAAESRVQSPQRDRLRSAPKNLLLWLLHGYKRVLSPMFLPSCRYVPTCSDYAAEAIEKHGAVRGAALAIWRLLRCHPFVRGGFDPVPNRLGAEFCPGTTTLKTAQSRQASRICSHITH